MQYFLNASLDIDDVTKTNIYFFNLYKPSLSNFLIRELNSASSGFLN
ncbi:hypothetical protein MARI151_30675 [Maribacter litoralis]|uniref:Uncharacterized protein n=1 Tax=Maribacter litoralis TaxID=2059726 RepID=A0A653TL26_9FLAO|nr:hypothetical protein MARI151_30675 [Maribacter litoralis]